MQPALLADCSSIRSTVSLAGWGQRHLLMEAVHARHVVAVPVLPDFQGALHPAQSTAMVTAGDVHACQEAAPAAKRAWSGSRICSSQLACGAWAGAAAGVLWSKMPGHPSLPHTNGPPPFPTQNPPDTHTGLARQGVNAHTCQSSGGCSNGDGQ